MVNDGSPKPRKKEKCFRFHWDDSEDTTAADDHLPKVAPSACKRIDPLDKESKDSKPWKQKSLAEMADRDWRIVREDFGISVKRSTGIEDVPPLRRWEECPLLSDKILCLLKEKFGWREPSPIQRQIIPLLLQPTATNVVGVAETGSGKSAAFLVPLLCRLLRLPRITVEAVGDGPHALILAPTRELAQQLSADAEALLRPFGLRCQSLVGGHSLQVQSFAMRDGVEVVVGTPGRLVDCLEHHSLSLNRCTVCILDEADRMIDLGFEESLSVILHENLFSPAHAPVQVALFTATLPVSLKGTIDQLLGYKYVTVMIGGENTSNTVSNRIHQIIRWISDPKASKKVEALRELLKKHLHQERGSIFVFFNARPTIESVLREVQKDFDSIAVLHSGRSQEARESALFSLRSGKCRILFATDVASRGLDLSDVALIVNFDMPAAIEVYVHRVGRTGRAGRSGVAVTLLTVDDSELFWPLMQVLRSDGGGSWEAPAEFTQHPSAVSRPGTVVPVKRKNQVIYTTPEDRNNKKS